MSDTAPVKLFAGGWYRDYTDMLWMDAELVSTSPRVWRLYRNGIGPRDYNDKGRCIAEHNADLTGKLHTVNVGALVPLIYNLAYQIIRGENKSPSTNTKAKSTRSATRAGTSSSTKRGTRSASGVKTSTSSSKR